MSFISMVFNVGGPQSSIGSLSLDALLSEETQLSSNASQFAVEDGLPVTDHITQLPEKLTMSGIVTAAAVSVQGAGGRSKLMQAKEVLRQIHEDRLPISLVTGLDIYTDYAMLNARIGRTNEGDKLSIDCEFQKVRKAQLRTADIPPGKVKGSAKGKAGTTGTKAGQASSAKEAAPKQKSDLKRIAGMFGG